MLDQKNTEEVLSSVVFLISCMERIENRLRLLERRVRDVETDQERLTKRADVDQLARLSRQIGAVSGELKQLVGKPASGAATPASMAVAVVVPVFNAPAEVEECLSSLFENGGYSRLVVVDDGSAEPTARLLDAMHRRREFTLIRNPSNKGYTKSINIGIQQVGAADAVVILNSDTVVTTGWLERIKIAFDANPKAGIVGPWSNAATYQSVPAVKDGAGQFAVNKVPPGIFGDDWALALRQQAPSYPRVPIINGFCFAVRRTVFDRIGTFDEAGFPIGYGEENDFCIRAADAGFEIVVADDAFVFHSKSASFGAARRKQLAADGRATLDRKHGALRLKKAVAALERSPGLEGARKKATARIAEAKPAALFSAFDGSIAYVLPAKPGGGGVHSVIQEASFLFGQGIKVNVFVPSAELSSFYAFYGESVRPLVTGYRGIHDLHLRLRASSVIVATVYRSVALIQDLLGTSAARFFYYVQDYEPFFHDEGTPEHREALATYDMDPRITLFAKTKWLQETIRDRHGRDVQVVLPSLDHDTFFARPGAAKRKGRICAMVRPPTPRRSPVETVALARKLATRRGKPLSVSLFGCEPDDPIFDPVRRLARVDCVGKLRREEVADLMRASDIFVDLSTYQAFGRASIEGMACGCVPIVPTKGGSAEFAVPGLNAFDVDVAEPDYIRAAVTKIDAIYADLVRFRELSLKTAARYSTRSAATSILKTFMRG